LCRAGEPVHLILEPDNKADPSAIMVFSDRDIQIGYITAERAPYIGKLIHHGADLRAIFQAAADWGAWIRVSLDGDEPTLPAVTNEAGSDPSDDDAYYSDPIWPDD